MIPTSAADQTHTDVYYRCLRCYDSNIIKPEIYSKQLNIWLQLRAKRTWSPLLFRPGLYLYKKRINHQCLIINTMFLSPPGKDVIRPFGPSHQMKCLDRHDEEQWAINILSKTRNSDFTSSLQQAALHSALRICPEATSMSKEQIKPDRKSDTKSPSGIQSFFKIKPNVHNPHGASHQNRQ